MDERTDLLKKELEEYTGSGIYPFHMPGHKRRISPAAGIAVDCDLTEVEGTDDLHQAHGILRAAMDRTAAFFGSRKTWFLVGGSTTGNLAAIRAVAPMGSEIIAARNCHKSVYHAIELGALQVHWIWPAVEKNSGICGSITPAQVKEALEQFPGSRAVVLTSPTYEGVVSDIAGIAAVCHAHRRGSSEAEMQKAAAEEAAERRGQGGIPLLVDEAHGAHLGLFETDYFPDSAVHQGADLIVQSAHKTLPSLTQTALLHLNGTRVDPGMVEEQLNIFETSSPSYLLLCSLDGCTGLLRKDGAALFHSWRERLEALDAALEERPLQHLQILCHGNDSKEAHPLFYAYDPGKLLIHLAGQGAGLQTGEALAACLRRKFRIETEMHCGRNVLCMTSCADTQEGYERLTEALRKVDERLQAETAGPAEDPAAAAVRQVMTIAEAVLQPKEWIPEEDSIGRVAAEYVYPYPPGIPVLVPGEEITEGVLQTLCELRQQGSQLVLTGSRSPEERGEARLVCVCR